MGFHFEGHCGYIDMAGFLQIPKDYNDHIIPAIKPPHRIQAA